MYDTTCDGELWLDSGEGAGEIATKSKEGSRCGNGNGEVVMIDNDADILS